MTVYIHKSGVCLLSFNQLTNEVVWTENDVVGNHIKSANSQDFEKYAPLRSARCNSLKEGC